MSKVDLDSGEIFDHESGFMPFLRTPYNYDTDAVSRETALHCMDKSLTQQHMAKECDINEIVRQFGLTGVLPNKYEAPVYADFTDVGDYRTALQAVREAGEKFMELPAELRARFENDPQRLIDFVGDERNRHEAFTLGLVSTDVPPDLATAPTAEVIPASKPVDVS
ncbi:MAG: internal scaffolding protein [Microviridae sp.]|nr:MAG: internal scaffolding protein [Microviridae sp.]